MRPLVLLLLAGCLPATAQEPPPSPQVDAIEAAIGQVERASQALLAGIGDGSIDIKTQGPAIVATIGRLGASYARLDALQLKAQPVDVGEVPPEAEALPKTERDTKKVAATTPGTTAPTATDVKTPAETPAEAPATQTSKTVVESEKTGVKSIDTFLQHVAQVSADMNDVQKKLESARGKLTSSLGLAKKFKAADAQKALTEQLGTGYKISLSPVKVTPGPDAKNPAIAANITSAYKDLTDVQKRLPTIIQNATNVGKEAVEVPKKAEADLKALGPLKAADALGKVAKASKTVTKVPKDAKDLTDEVTLWTKIAGG